MSGRSGLDDANSSYVAVHKPQSFLSCQQTGVPLIITGDAKEFDKSFRALRKAHRALDPTASGTLKTVSRWSNSAGKYVATQVVVDDPSSDSAAAVANAAANAAASASRFGYDDGDDDGGGMGTGTSVLACASRLIGFANATTDTDHPLCEKASAAVNRRLTHDLAEARRALSSYSTLLKTLQARHEPGKQSATPGSHLGVHGSADDSATGTAAFDIANSAELERDVARLTAELEQVQLQRQRLRASRAARAARLRRAAQLRHKAWTAANDALHTRAQLEEDTASVGQLRRRLLADLDHFSSCCVLNDAFHIWHRGAFGTINGFRLGRMPQEQVTWEEVNAALGQAAMLLVSISERAGIRFRAFRLIPMGSYSRIERNSDGSVFPLHWDGGLLRKRGFNNALISFLACVHEACVHAQQRDPTVQLPYRIWPSEGKIGDARTGELSICYSNDDRWPRALKFMLTHLKWLLVWISSNNFAVDEGSMHT